MFELEFRWICMRKSISPTNRSRGAMIQDSEFDSYVSKLQLLEGQLLSDPYSAPAMELLSQYAEMVRVLIVCATQRHRGLRINWRGFNDLKVECGTAGSSEETAEHVAQIVQAVDFIVALEKRYKAAQVEANDEFGARLKELRAERYAKYREQVADQQGRAEQQSQGEGAGQPVSKKQQLLTTNKKITSTLMRTSHLLQSSVMQSELNLGELQEQTRSMHKLNDRFDSLSGVLHTSSKIVKIINDSSGRERRQIYTGLSFLGLCIAWVLWRRIFKLPVKLALWMWFRFSRAVLASLGALPKAKVAVPMVLNTVAPTLASTATSAFSTLSAQTTATEQAAASMESLVQDAVDGAFARIRDEL
ncbi:LAQU0S03e07668g1_1 [Lachancea quebecensis]|uniref:LAQU0S03e07668g1_1 n=1 Tax=Lachancea quebecensis TaxID=1654605 RepID=A0A0P1KRV8_9SACH|nr:LAQU0S03e07668g1_1 [Lachancea quebecensis]